jgi:2-dehydro-3-deoxygalactonokinase
VAEVESADGAAHLAAQTPPADRPARFGSVLAAALSRLAATCGQPLDQASVVISGMASSSIGWQELPYARLPLALDGQGLVWRELPRPVDFPAARLVLISGAATSCDVLRGEETQVLGLFQLGQFAKTQFAGASSRALVIMPGTHSKHSRIEAGRIEDFRTFMTGELFDVLASHSILRHSVSHDAGLDLLSTDELHSALRGGVERAAELPLSAALFQVRTRQVLDAQTDEANRAFLSGILIGSELAYLIGPEFSGYPLLLCAAPPLAACYATALSALGIAERLAVVSGSDFQRLTALGQAVVLAKAVAG